MRTGQHFIAPLGGPSPRAMQHVEFESVQFTRVEEPDIRRAFDGRARDASVHVEETIVVLARGAVAVEFVAVGAHYRYAIEYEKLEVLKHSRVMPES